MALEVDIEKRLGNDFTLRVAFRARDCVTALLGASGSGKSLTCRCIAGIEQPDRGRIALDGRVLFDSERRINLPPQKRRTGYLFQQYALFPNMTVKQNVACAVRKRPDRDRIVARMLERVQMTGFEDRLPRQLSGGQQQRVALARMLVGEPDILLLDEPFSALDSHLRFRLQRETGQLMREFGKTVLLVSHDRDEVYRLSDDIAILRDGRVEAFGEKHAVFAAPGTVAGARLTGCKNVSRIERAGDGRALAVEWGIAFEAPALPADVTHVGVRMHDVTPGCPDNAVVCRVAEEIETPFTYTVMLVPAGVDCTTPIGMEMPKADWLRTRAPELSVGFPRNSLLWLKD